MNFIEILRYELGFYELEGDTIVDDYIYATYYYLFQLSGFYPLLRNGLWKISMVHFIFIHTILIFNYCMFLLPTVELLDVSLVIFSQNIMYAIGMQHVCTNLIWIQRKRSDIAQFIRATSTSFFDYNEPFQGNLNKFKKEMNRERNFWMFLPFLAGITVAFLIIITPTIDEYGEFDFNKISSIVNENLPYRFSKSPFLIEDDFVYYLAVFSQICCIGIMGLVFAAAGIAFIDTSQRLLLEMKVLQDYIRHIEIRTLNMVTLRSKKQLNLPDDQLYNNDLFITCYEQCLNRNFQHHQIILRYFRTWTSMYSFAMFTGYFHSTIAIALSLISVGSWKELPGTNISSCCVCLIEVCSIYIFFYFSQKITNLNEEIRNEIYGIKWYNCNMSIRKSITIIQVMSLRPMLLKGCGIIPANMESFSAVMSGAYSYYNMVNAFSET